MIRVLIADDHALVRRGFRRLLEDDPEIEVAGEAGDGPEVHVGQVGNGDCCGHWQRLSSGFAAACPAGVGRYIRAPLPNRHESRQP